MHQRDFTNPPPVDYARPPDPADWPQCECGGVSVVLGGAIIFLSLCFAFLHMAFSGAVSGRLLVRVECSTVALAAGVGVVLAVCGFRQRFRRHSAALAGLVLNGLLLAAAVVGFLVA
jgi:hypothetical protein